MAFTVLYKFDISAAFDATKVGVRLLSVFKKYETAMKKDFERTTIHFKNHHPEFTGQSGYRGGDIFVSVGTDDEIYYYLDRGTSVRYATMSVDFIAKTTPGTLSTSTGRGNLSYVNRNIPRPGIEPRNFTQQIFDKYSKTFFRDISDAVNRGLVARKLKGG